MTRIGASRAAGFLVLGLTLPTAASARDLTFEDRVRAQEQIERVYYAHQVGATLPFEQAVPRRILEEKVLRFVERARAVAERGRGPESQGLVREMERIAASTRLPGRLLEIYAALGHHPHLVLECFVRPALTERLARGGKGTSSRTAARAEERSSHQVLPSIAPAGATLPRPRGLGGEGTTDEGSGPDAADDTWTSGVLDEGPLRRERHTAVWTGSLMIVWGGTSIPGNSPRAHRYDPVADTWSDISTAGAPSLRYGHTAVWTGQRMVVWGGGSNTGGRYDPVADTWSETSVVGAPSPRQDHTAVWTGTRMIVWGGAGAPLGDGASYDPATDAWSPIQSQGAPSPRSGHTAVWTGSRMIVWGGGVTNTGAVYDPAQDSWAPTATAGAPDARTSHTAVWTGSVMVVWGGTSPTKRGGTATPLPQTSAATSPIAAPPWSNRSTLTAGGCR